MDSLAESEIQKPKQRPIIRIGIFIISHSFFVSVICCTAGVLALLLLPVLAKKTYVSENALMPVIGYFSDFKERISVRLLNRHQLSSRRFSSQGPWKQVFDLLNGLSGYGWRYIWHKHQNTAAAKGDLSTTNLMSIEYNDQYRFMIIPDMLKNAPMFKCLEARIKGKGSALGVGRGRAVAM